MIENWRVTFRITDKTTVYNIEDVAPINIILYYDIVFVGIGWYTNNKFEEREIDT